MNDGLAGRRNGVSKPPAVLLFGLGALAFAFHALVLPRSHIVWNVDFNEFYAAGKLAGSGHLYDWDAIEPLELGHASRAVPFGRIPAFALAFKPLSMMSYGLARSLWVGIGVAALAGFALLWPTAGRLWFALALCWSVPAILGLGLGQDSILMLLFVALGLHLLLGGHEFAAGLVLSLCAAKPHLALLLPVWLAASKKWNALLGGALGGAALLAASFAVEGRHWPQSLLALARKPEFDSGVGLMPNLRGILSLGGGGLAVEIPIAAAVIGACWILSRRLPLPAGAALALAGGLLVSHHAYAYDAVLLLPALLLPFAADLPQWTRQWALILFTPAPYLLLLTFSPWEPLGHIAITGYTLALLAWGVYRGWGKAGKAAVKPG